ncbi:unnamed protein product [Gongylonema pulchrum]|uniref:G_PROTEIN_RECEP_F1_2 domain-containing protein n=1 Tax=Gongylonema pulchrum TaxID=637853 RepID=A0A183ERE0_9BILA|nr:unnamed protein product [Gongylonema pulchrum]
MSIRNGNHLQIGSEASRHSRVHRRRRAVPFNCGPISNCLNLITFSTSCCLFVVHFLQLQNESDISSLNRDLIALKFTALELQLWHRKKKFQWIPSVLYVVSNLLVFIEIFDFSAFSIASTPISQCSTLSQTSSNHEVSFSENGNRNTSFREVTPSRELRNLFTSLTLSKDPSPGDSAPATPRRRGKFWNFPSLKQLFLSNN